ncbi:MAG: alkylmercury lyase [Chloroflexi bacterium]|nr:alkylmercury lyase [Chloroflexota bacterium]
MTKQALSKDDLQALTDTMIAFFDESTDQILHLSRTAKLLSDGSPVSPTRIATELQLSHDETDALFQMGELDQDGNLVGLGISLVPTPHSYQVNGRQLYTWCAADAIIYSVILKTNAIIESPDPISGDKIRLTATPEGVRDLEPSTAVVSHVSSTKSLEYVREWSCRLTHFFTSVETASQYVSQHPGLVIIPVDEVFQLYQPIWEREPYKSLIADL